VALLALQPAHLRYQRFGAAHFHAIDNVGNLHRGSQGARRSARARFSIVLIDDSNWTGKIIATGS
jgi:hypothetical protein